MFKELLYVSYDVIKVVFHRHTKEAWNWFAPHLNSEVLG